MSNGIIMNGFNGEVDRRVAIITGGTKGLGLGIAHQLAEDGYDLILNYNSDDCAAENAKSVLRDRHGGEVVIVKGSIAEQETIEKLFKVVKNTFQNNLTAVIHNAGSIPHAYDTPSADGDPTYFLKWAQVYYQMYASCFGHLINRGLGCRGFKRAIAMSSPGCNMNTTPFLNYELQGVGKSAMEFLVRVEAKKLGHKGITVNCIVPGIVYTEPWQKLAKGALKKDDLTEQEGKDFCEKFAEQFAMKRAGTAKEVADATVFLCSDRASWITGVCLPVDGGLHLGR